SKKILVEVALLKAIQARSAVNINSVLKQLNDLRQSSGAQASNQTVPVVEPTRAKAPATETVARMTPAPEQVSPAVEISSDLQELWTRVVEAVGRASPFARTYLLEAHPVSFKNSLFIIGFDPEFEDHIGLVDNARNHTLLQTKLLELGHPNTQ